MGLIPEYVINPLSDNKAVRFWFCTNEETMVAVVAAVVEVVVVEAAALL